MSLSKSASASAAEDSVTNYISVCGICLSAYEVPKALPCLHSFCLECIREWARAYETATNSKSSVSCPTCRKKCVLPENGVDGLPTNFFITERTQSDTIPACSSCDNHRDIVARCYECGFVCKECMLSHKAMRALKEHDLIVLDKIRAGKTAKQMAGGLAISKRHENGAFKLEKTINLTNIDSSYNAYCCTILPASKYHVAVATESTVSSKVHILGIDGKNKLTIDTQVGLHPGCSSRPCKVCMNSNGIIYITDEGPWVKVHNAQGQFMRLCQLYDVNGIPCKAGSAQGMCIEDKQQIIVGDVKSKAICIYRHDESFVKRFGVDIHPYYLAATFRDTLLVSAVNENRLLEVDYSGKVLHKITSPVTDMAWKPRGMCCNKDGEIFVVNAASDKGSVIRFSDSWKYTGCVASGLRNPSGISISDDGEIMAVIDSCSELKIFRWS